MGMGKVAGGQVSVHFCPPEGCDPDELGEYVSGFVMTKEFDNRWAMLVGFVRLWWTTRRLW